MIKLENITHKYDEKIILDNISFEINEGDTFGILGASGAGKTTLLKLMSLRMLPSSGNLHILGEKINNLNNDITKSFLNDIGYIFQDFSLLYNLNVLGNVALPLKLKGIDKVTRKELALKLLEITGIKHLYNKYPSNLSGGEAQRVSIARALITNPKILLCDEPTSQLDDKTTIDILNLLKELSLKFNLTTIIISHDVRVIKYLCNKALILEDGKIKRLDKITIKKNIFINEEKTLWGDTL